MSWLAAIGTALQILLALLSWIREREQAGRTRKELLEAIKDAADEKIAAAERARAEPHSLQDDPNDRANRG